MSRNVCPIEGCVNYPMDEQKLCYGHSETLKVVEWALYKRKSIDIKIDGFVTGVDPIVVADQQVIGEVEDEKAGKSANTVTRRKKL